MRGEIGERIHPARVAEWQSVLGDGYCLHVDLHVDVDREEVLTLGASVARTLTDDPRWLHCRWLYDKTGSELYEHITEQPEYYLTRVEDRILADNTEELFRMVGPATLVELGSGSSSKTRRLLETWLAHGETRYVPIDISRDAIEPACASLAVSFPQLAIEGLAARYRRGLPLIGDVSPLMLLFLGSTIGNFNDDELDEFLGLVAAALNPGDHFLLGVDLVKDPTILDAAYNDGAGWTERFMLNVLARMNRELGSGIPLEGIVYEGGYNADLERVEMFLRFTEGVDVRVPQLSEPVHIAAGERVMIEISRKFRLDRMVAKMHEFGFALQRRFVDPDAFFAVLLLTRES